MTEGGRFRWRGFAALVPVLLPAGLPGTGRVEFRYAIGAPLAGSYDSVVTLLFDGESAAELNLLLLYDGAGVRLTPAEPAAAALEVARVNRSAVVMYFSFASADGG